MYSIADIGMPSGMCLCLLWLPVPWHTHHMTGMAPVQAASMLQQGRNVGTDQAHHRQALVLHKHISPCTSGRTQHSWCDFFVTGRWGSRPPRDHGDRKGRRGSGSVLSGFSLWLGKCHVVCPGLHPDTSASSLSCWDRSPHVATPDNTAWGIPVCPCPCAQHIVNMWSPSWKLWSS